MSRRLRPATGARAFALAPGVTEIDAKDYKKALAAAKREEQKAIRESLENEMLRQLTDAGLPAPVQQHAHVPKRGYRLDFAWPDLKLGLEVDGGIRSYQPSHASASGIIRDIEKHNAGIEHGWTVLRAHSDMVWDGSAVKLVARVMQIVASRP